MNRATAAPRQGGRPPALLVDRGMPAPVEAAAEDRLHDEMIRRGGSADADPDIDLPDRRYIEIGDDEDLLLLIANWRTASRKPT